jgi:antitoxin component YwqK of YwqJK toxin-antitoxin module
MRVKFTFIILLAILLGGCKPRTTVVESTYPDGSPKRVCVYLGSGENRELIGETTYYKNKKVQKVGEYKEGEMNGKWTYYYETGIVWSDGFFKKGKSDGKRTTFFPNGKTRYVAFYQENKRVGAWQFYDTTGKLIKTVDYSKPENNNVQDVPEKVTGK